MNLYRSFFCPWRWLPKWALLTAASKSSAWRPLSFPPFLPSPKWKFCLLLPPGHRRLMLKSLFGSFPEIFYWSAPVCWNLSFFLTFSGTCLVFCLKTQGGLLSSFYLLSSILLFRNLMAFVPKTFVAIKTVFSFLVHFFSAGTENCCGTAFSLASHPLRVFWCQDLCNFAKSSACCTQSAPCGKSAPEASLPVIMTEFA